MQAQVAAGPINPSESDNMVKRPAIYLPSLRQAALSGPAAFVAAGLLSLLVAYGAALLIERLSTSAVKSRLLTEGITWADVQSDGLQVQLIGIAPNEAARYRVVNLVGSEVDASRVRDQLEITPVKAIEAPHFSLEILRNDDGIQIIGLLPNADAESALIDKAKTLAQDAPFSEMIETATYPATPEWDAALAFGVRAFEMLPRSKISISAARVSVTAIATSVSEKRAFDTELLAAKPAGLNTVIEVSAPRPVLTPFTMRFVKDAAGARFDACAADTEKAKKAILAAGVDAGAVASDSCTVGLGVPSPSWGTAVKAGIAAVGTLASGTITFKDADVTLQAGSDVSQADFDRVVGDLEAALPDVFSLNAMLEPRAEGRSEGPAEFTATLAADTGKVELRGRLTDEMLRGATENFAKAAFGTGNVYQAARLDPELPAGWPVRVLSGLEALAELDSGTLTVQADLVSIQGVSGVQTARARISQILSDKLGQGKAFKVDVTYDQALDPVAALPTPQVCADRVAKVLDNQKIVFPPSSTEIDASADKVMAAIADALTDCVGIKIEIGGHTDGQGSDQGNQALSQARAEAVLVALQGRQVDVSGFTAKGYGESVPLGDNETEAGRETNRRIEFKLTAGQSVTPQADTASANVTVVDDSPSVAPEKVTTKPKSRPAKTQ